jgi:mannosyltransferase
MGMVALRPLVRAAAPLTALVALSTLVRFGTLGSKGFWGDEVSTVDLAHRSLGHMLTGIGNLESTPPLYYVLSWAWIRLVPSTEVGIRALPALCGVALVPVTYLIARELAPRRAATIAAALVACNPFLVWYSQEARAYSLLALLSAIALVLFIRVLKRPSARLYAGWAFVSALALATHYFAAFLAVPEAVILLWAAPRRLPALLAVSAVGLTGASLLPLAIHQQHLGHAAWIAHASLIGRLGVTPLQFLVGFDVTSVAYPAAAVALLAALVGLWRLNRAPGLESSGRTVAIVVCACFALAAVLAVLGLDYLDPRNLIVALVPMLVLLAIGFAAPARERLGVAAAVALCVGSLAVVLLTAGEPKYHSEDWRTAAGDLGPPRVDRLVVAVPGNFARKPLEFYLPGSTELPASGDPVREVDALALPHQGSTEPAAMPPLSAPRLHLVGRDSDGRFVVWRYRPTGTPWITPAELAPLLGPYRPALLWQRPETRPFIQLSSTRDNLG